jgi:cytochrome P450
LCGVRIPAGSTVAAVLAAANRDPRNFRDPDRFDIRRREGGHLGFAVGPHACIGALLGRMEAQTGLAVLFEAVRDLRLQPNCTVNASGWEFRSPICLPVEFCPAA